jgi:hypothetical protein
LPDEILRNLVLGLFRLARISQVKRLTESIAADRMRILSLLAAAPQDFIVDLKCSEVIRCFGSVQTGPPRRCRPKTGVD